jgi:predicted transcriptional regulator
MNNGWIKLHRQILENEFLAHDNNAFMVFTKLLLLANKKNGRYITGRYRFAEIVNLNPSTARNVLDRLCKEGLVDTEKDRLKTVITICKFKQYQQLKDSDEDNQRTIKGQPKDTKQELRIKNKEIVSKDTMVAPIYGKPEINLLVEYWHEQTGVKISSAKQANRNACNNLLKKYGVDDVQKLIRMVAAAQEDKFAPRIADFTELQAKLNKLALWSKTQQIDSINTKGIKL